jgi:hypothetical protein
LSTPSLITEGTDNVPQQAFVQWNDPHGSKLVAINRDGTIFTQGLNFQNGSQQLRAVQTARVSSTINPGLSTVDLLWGTPFADNSYYVLFPNPPFAPGAIDPIPPANTRTDAWTSTINGHFTPQFGTFDIASAKLEVATVDGGSSRASMGWVESSNWAANQYAQLQITATEAGAGALGPAIYVQDGAFYAFYVEAGVAYLFKQVGLVTTVLNSTAATLSVNDILYLEIAGQTLTAKQNGIVIMTAFEAVPLPVGNPGVNGRLTSTLRANNWQAGNLQIPIIAVIPVVLGPWVYLPAGSGIRMSLQNLNVSPLQVQIDAVGIQAS